MSSGHQAARAKILRDACQVIFMGLLFLGVTAVLLYLPAVRPPWLDVLGRLLGAMTVQLLLVATLRELVRRPPTGTMRLDRGDGYVRLLVSRAFRDAVNHPAVRWPFSFLQTTRYLYLRAQGVRMSYSVHLPPDFSVSEPSLLAIEAGSRIGPGATISNFALTGRRVQVDAVSIGRGCTIGARAHLMPGVVLGHGTQIGVGAHLGCDVHLGMNVVVGDRVTLASGVDVASHSKIGTGAVVAEGVWIAENARVMPGAVIPPRTRIREGETWQGVPARPVFRETSRPSSQTV